MSGIIAFINQMLGDDAGVASTKRVVTFLFTVLIIVAFVADLFWNLTIDTHLVDAAMAIVIAGFGFTGVEKFAPKFKTLEGTSDVP